jgi:hypothetical protein
MEKDPNFSFASMYKKPIKPGLKILPFSFATREAYETRAQKFFPVPLLAENPIQLRAPLPNCLVMRVA